MIKINKSRINDLKYYCDYKRKQFSIEKIKLNFSLTNKMKRGQNEVNYELFMEKEEKPHELIIEN